jgi:hypothetical protein
MIKPKIGQCTDCPEDSEPKPLVAGRCQRHYWLHREKINSTKPKAKAKQERGKELNVYFANQILTMPATCEESGQPLPKSPLWMRKACIAHILPKRPDFGFPSVATHPLNRIFLHPDIHTNMDNQGESYILKMKSLPIMKARVAQFIHLLTPAELNRLPHYFLPDDTQKEVKP